MPATQSKLKDPFSDEEPAPAEPLHSIEALQEMAALLRMVQHYREEAERLADDFDRMAALKRLRYEALKKK